MKKINTIIAMMICAALVSCSKQADKPVNQGNGSGTSINSVATSGWLTASWQQTGPVDEYIMQVPQLGSDLIKDGKVLVFGKGGFEMRIPTALPSHFDENYITSAFDPGRIILTLQGSGAISSTLQFRYVLIPVNKLATGNLNYDDYDVVCDYYNIRK
jgi:hypothetical protein